MNEREYISNWHRSGLWGTNQKISGLPPSPLIHHSSPRSRCGERGFTFIEIMVVVVIIGLLAAALALPLPAGAQGNRGQAPVQVKTTLLGGSVYGVDGQGGRMAALVGPEIAAHTRITVADNGSRPVRSASFEMT